MGLHPGLFILWATLQSAPPGDFPPAPDFEKRFDYVAWYESAARKGIKRDAYPAYAKFMPGLVSSKVDESAWPRFEGMLTGEGWDEGPTPWMSKEHPEWEQSYLRTKDFLVKFVAATREPGFVVPSGLKPGVDSGPNSLIKRRLGYVDYFLTAAKGILEGAWRVDAGDPMNARLIAAAETCLRAAGQLEQSLTATEQTAALNLRLLAYEHLRWGFAHEVLKEGDAAKIKGVLARLDGEPIDVRRGLRGEAAAVSEALQYIFGPAHGGGGGVKLNAPRFQEITGTTMGANRMSLGARIESNAPGTADAFVQMFRDLDSRMEPPYSTSQFAPINEAVQRANQLNQVTRAMGYAMPANLSVLYTTAMRCETQRRGTHALVQIFDYKAKKKKWPPKFSNLAKKAMAKINPDPCSGKPFGYEASPEGPTLYSAGFDGDDDGGNHDPQWSQGDFVLWPVPESSKTVAAAKLKDAPKEVITAISKINADMVGEEVTVVAKVTKVESQPSRQFRRIHYVTLSEGKANIILVYHADIEEKLSNKQAIKAGATVRAIARVEKDDKGLRLALRDADGLVVEKTP